MKKLFFKFTYGFIFKVFLFLLISSCNKRIERESIIYYEAETLNPKIILKQELLNCGHEYEACFFEKFQLTNIDDTIINGVIYPSEEILNIEDLNTAPQFQFSFEHLDYSEIEKIEYKYIKYNATGSKIAETNYKTLSFIDNDYKIPLHTSTLGAGVLITEINQTNEIKILIRTYSNYYFTTSFKFYMFSQINTPIEVSRDLDLLDTPYYNFENVDLHILDIINIRNKLNLKLSLNIDLEVNNTTKASIETINITNYTQQVNLQGPSVYEWKTNEIISYNSSSVKPSFLVFTLDELGNIEQILVNTQDNFIYINDLTLRENKNISLLVTSNFLKLNILGLSNQGPIYSNLSHCQNINNLNLCKCWYNASSSLFSLLFMPPEPNNFNINIFLIAYMVEYNSLMNYTSLIPNCSNPSTNLILAVNNIYKTSKNLLARLHKTSTSIYLDIKLKDYKNFGTILEKYISFPDIEVQSGELIGEETLYGYVR